MNLTVSTALVHQLRGQRNIFAGILGVCLLLNVLQGLERLTVCEKIIILPPDIQQGVWIQKNKISQSFLEEWGVYLTQLWLNVSPSTIGYQKDLLLRHVGPDSYGEINNMIDLEADHLRKNQATTTFLVRNLVVNIKDMTVTLSGFQATYVGKERVSDTPLSVRLFFRLERAGKLELINLKRLGKEEAI